MHAKNVRADGVPDCDGTLRVRIAVAVAGAREWSAVGGCVYDTDAEAAAAAGDLTLERGGLMVFVTADIPLPRNGSDIKVSAAPAPSIVN